MARRLAKHKHPLFFIWKHMWARCTQPSVRSYPLYGGRGVKVCPEWKDIERFAADVGPRPGRAYSLDRHPNRDGNYEPGNVRWATATEQARNRSDNRLLTFNGRTECLSAWASERGMSPHTLMRRLGRLGWSVERALTEPVRPITRGEQACS